MHSHKPKRYRNRQKKGGSEKKMPRKWYKHENYNLDNLYKNRLHEAQPANNKNQSEYETGLTLWERRSEGGIIADEQVDKKECPQEIGITIAIWMTKQGMK